MQTCYRVGDIVEVRSKRRPQYNHIGTIESVSPQYLTVWYHHQSQDVVWAYTPAEADKFFHRYF